MAMVCVTGGRECDGCMRCREQKVVEVCRGCGEDICDGDEYFDVLGKPYCECCCERKTAEAEDF